MRERSPFQYTVLRVVPRLERGEFVNVGVVVFCRQRGFLAARIHVDEQRIRALFPAFDPAALTPPLAAIDAVLGGDPAAGALATLAPSERFGWVAARSSTVIQAAEVHTGITEDPPATLERLFEQLVLPPLET